MKKILLSIFVCTTVFSGLAQAKNVPDSGASGDMRRVLTSGLRDMMAVSVPSDYSGDYIGLYDLECKYAGSRPMLCTASDKEGGIQSRWNSDSGAVLVGTVLKANVEGGEKAFSIKVKKVGCNLVGDECFIKGVSIETLP